MDEQGQDSLFTYIHSNAHPDETDTLLNSHVSAVAYEDVQDEEGKFPCCAPMSELAGKGGFLATPALCPVRQRRPPANCWPTSPACGDPHHHHAGLRRGRYRRLPSWLPPSATRYVFWMST